MKRMNGSCIEALEMMKELGSHGLKVDIEPFFVFRYFFFSSSKTSR